MTQMNVLQQPQWLKKTLYSNPNIDAVKRLLKEFNLNTVCQAARCPNIFDCFSKRTATLLILGNTCTRNCGFCCVLKGRPGFVDEEEPAKITEAAALLGLRHIVITSVTRDDLSDGGSGQFSRVVQAIRTRIKDITIEVLIPDFSGDEKAIKSVVDANPDIFGHNIETAPRLYPRLRAKANYEQSLGVLRTAKLLNPGMTTKSAIMLGLGETEEEVISVMKDLRGVRCDAFAIGQYLRPSCEQVAVKEFINPEKFLNFKRVGYSLGFKEVRSAPFVRSSYKEIL